MSITLSNPFTLFGEWFAAANGSEPNDPNAVALASVAADGMPSQRMVLLKGYDEHGFVFYTNLGSQKARELAANPKAALLFHWKSLQRQIRIQGEVQPVTAAEADAYFASRARDSRIGAWASKQSQPMQSRFELEQRVAAFALKYPLGEIPRPEFWSGFRLVPQVMEFWQAGTFRLHDRVRLERQANGHWQQSVLFP